MQIKPYNIYVLLGILLILFLSSFSSNRTRIHWELVWMENFDEDSLNMETWSFMNRGKDDSRKFHSSSNQCYDLKNGKLTIRGIKNSNLKTDSACYLTGGITTESKKSFSAPGRIEIKAKIGSAKGAWPAFWLLPYKYDKGWPADGEIDIMEHLNYDDFVFQTVHSSYTKQNNNALPQQFVKAKIKPNKYNIYRVDIVEDYVRFYVNGKETLTYPRIDTLMTKGEFPFYRDWFLMLDMQLGGNWVGSIDSCDMPVEVVIDWVKYYQPQ